MRLLTSADVLLVTLGLVAGRALFFSDRPWTNGVIAWAASLAVIATVRFIINQRNP